MDQHCQVDRKRKFKQAKTIDEDDEQIEKTLNFFDSIIDPYLLDQDTHDQQKNKSDRKLISQPIKTNGHAIQQVKQEFDVRFLFTSSCIFMHSTLQVNTSMNTNTSSSSSSSSQKTPQRPVDIHASHFHQFQNIRCRFEQMTSAASNSSSNNVRRYTSENNLNELHGSSSSSKPVLPQKLVRPIPLQTIATSTEDLTSIPAWKKLSPQARLSALLDKTNHPSSTSSSSFVTNGTSASLIDLTSIDKMPNNKQQIQAPPATRPRFRFVPPSDQNSVLKEEPELEQQQSGQNYDHFEQKPLSPNRATHASKFSRLFLCSVRLTFFFLDGPTKPTVIHPPTRSTNFTQPENNLHHQNGTSAFKPPLSHANNHLKSPTSPTNNLQRPNLPPQNPLHSNGNGPSYRTSQPPPVPNIKRTESTHKPGVHVGITNPNGLLIRQHPSAVPQFHQSMLNLSSIGTSEIANSTQPAVGMFGSRISLQSTSNNFMKHPAYTPQAAKTNGNHQYSHPPQPNVMSRPPPPTILEDPIIRWIQQVNNSSSMTGLTSNGGGIRPTQQQQQQQQQSQQPYPYGSYISNNAGLPPTTNGSDHPHRSQNYLNQINVHKHHSSQHTVPVQSAYLASSPVSRNIPSSSVSGNVYHFSQQVRR